MFEKETPPDHSAGSWLLSAGVSGLGGKEEGTEEQGRKTMLGLRKDNTSRHPTQGHSQGQT